MAQANKYKKLKLIAATGFGNFLETFDFTVYSYFATIIGLIILKTDDPISSTYISTILFGLGFLSRPLGSIILGSYADRHGRKSALFITILLMGLGSALIAFAPPYAAIGLAAPLLVLLGRLLQGFSAGGEIGSASALLLESAQTKQRGIYVAWQFMMQGVSAAAGALCAYFLFSILSEQQMLSWGWRLPFFFALLIIPVGLYIRAHIEETWQGNVSDKEIQARQPQAASDAPSTHHPMREIWTNWRKQFLLAILTVMPVTLLVYIMVIFMPTYLNLIPISSGAAFLSQGGGRFMLTVGTGLLMTIAAFVGGYICDRLQRRKPFAVVCLVIALIASFMTYSFVGVSFPIFIIALCVSVWVLGMLMTIQALLVLEAFPRAIRVTGMAVSIAAGACIFGGSAQAIVTKLMMLTAAAPLTPFYYLGPMLLIAILAYLAFREDRFF